MPLPRRSAGGGVHSCRGKPREEPRRPAVNSKLGGLSISSLKKKELYAWLFIAHRRAWAVQLESRKGPWKDPPVLKGLHPWHLL